MLCNIFFFSTSPERSTENWFKKVAQAVNSLEKGLREEKEQTKVNFFEFTRQAWRIEIVPSGFWSCSNVFVCCVNSELLQFTVFFVRVSCV